jgi:acyl carrier protein
MWYSLLALKKITENTLVAHVMVDESSLWFSGHFTDNPILPGIAQLNMTADVIALSKQENLCIKRISRVKFKKIVRPGERLEIRTSAAETPNLYTFRITSEAQDVCSGTMFLAAKTATDKSLMTSAIDKTITRIAEIIISELKLEDVTPATLDPYLDLVDEVGIDSMDLATIALVIRDEFGIRIDEDDYPKLTTIRIIAEYVNEKQNSGE